MAVGHGVLLRRDFENHVGSVVALTALAKTEEIDTRVARCEWTRGVLDPA